MTKKMNANVQAINIAAQTIAAGYQKMQMTDSDSDIAAVSNDIAEACIRLNELAEALMDMANELIPAESEIGALLLAEMD